MASDPRDFGDRPSGPLSSQLWEFDRQLTACRLHATAEGHEIDARSVLEGYDRALHPWLRGWRVGEIRATLTETYRQLKHRLGIGGLDATDGDPDE